MAESYNLCLDIGGTKVLGAIFNSKREIVYRIKKKTKAGGDSSQNVEEVIINVATIQASLRAAATMSMYAIVAELGIESARRGESGAVGAAAQTAYIDIVAAARSEA